MSYRIRAVCADITTLSVDAIVNAAKSSLMGGGGVDGAIHRAAGPDLLHECSLLGGCKTGEAKLTKGHRVPANFIIHAVGPIWRGGESGEPDLLASCYRNSLELASETGITTIAFPSISTGIYGYPFELAARIAVGTVRAGLKDQHVSMEEVLFCCFSPGDLQVYEELLSESAAEAAMSRPPATNHNHPAWGWLCIAIGLYPISLALGVVPVGDSSVNAPMWILASSGVAFVLGGCMVLLGQRSRLNNLLAALLCLVFASAGVWVALFSPPEGFSGGVPFLSNQSNVTLSRWVFGCGAGVSLAISVYAFRLFSRPALEPREGPLE